MGVKERVKYFYEVVTSNGQVDEVPEYVAENCTVRVGENIYPAGVEGMKQHLLDVKRTYPDFKMTVTRQYCDGDYVITEFIMQGTHLGEWLGMKPSGKKVTISGVDIDKVIDGKIVEHGGAANTFEGLLEAQLIQPVR